MGVTIHFEGFAANSEAFDEICKKARNFANERGWEIEPIDEKEVTLQRVKDDVDWDYVGSVSGLSIYPHENSEPFRLEFDKEYFIQEYIKTQFAPVGIHKSIVQLLKQLQPHFKTLQVVDEAEYFESGSESVLQNHLDKCFELLDGYLQDAEKYYGPIRLENGRIVDVMER